MKDKDSKPENIVQGAKRVAMGISNMHVDHEADGSNGDTEYNSESKNEDDDNYKPMPGAWLHQIFHHTKNETGSLNPYWALLTNHSMVHMFRKHALLENTKGADKPIDVYSIGGATHCDTSGTINNIGDVYLNENGLANILYYAKVKDRHNIT